MSHKRFSGDFGVAFHGSRVISTQYEPNPPTDHRRVLSRRLQFRGSHYEPVWADTASAIEDTTPWLDFAIGGQWQDRRQVRLRGPVSYRSLLRRHVRAST